MSDTVRISSIGVYIPEERVSNHEKAIKFGYDDFFLEKKLGFISTAIKKETDTTVTMCLEAFADLMIKSEIDTDEIQLVTVVTQNPTVRIPHTSAIIHNVLNLNENCMTFDISQGCSGYCHGLQIVKGLMDTIGLKKGLIFTCDSYREIMDEEDRNVSMIFGDGATATLLSRNSPSGYVILDSIFGTAKDSNQCLILKDEKLNMKGWDITQLARGLIPKSIDKILEVNDLTKDDIDFFFLHQGSKHIIKTIQNELEIPAYKTSFYASEIGNTVSSAIPIQLAQYFGSQSKPKIIISGFGVGFTWGTCLLEYQ